MGMAAVAFEHQGLCDIPAADWQEKVIKMLMRKSRIAVKVLTLPMGFRRVFPANATDRECRQKGNA